MNKSILLEIWNAGQYLQAVQDTAEWGQLLKDKGLGKIEEAAVSWTLLKIDSIHRDTDWLGIDILMSKQSPLKDFQADIFKIWDVLEDILIGEGISE